MAERVPAYPFPEPESQTSLGGVKPQSDSANVSVPADLYKALSCGTERTFRSAKSATRTAFTRMKDVLLRLVEEHPIHLVVSVAVAAFITGAGLRIWRSRHE